MARAKQTARKSTGGVIPKARTPSPKGVGSAGSLNKKTVVQLQSQCKALGIACKGKKADIIAAIITAGATGVKEIKVPTATKKKSPIKKKTVKRRSPVKKGRGRTKSRSPRSKSKSRSKSRSRSKSKSKKPAAKQLPKGAYRPPSPFRETKMKKISEAEKKAIIKRLKADIAKHTSPKVSPRKKKSTTSPFLETEMKPMSPSKKKAMISKMKADMKKKSPTKKSPTKKAKSCIDKVDPLICDDDQICSATSSKAAKCVKKTTSSKYGTKGDKSELNVDGRIIVGLPGVIKNLQKILGGTITASGERMRTPKKVKTPSPRKSPKKKTPSPVKRKSPSSKGKEEASSDDDSEDVMSKIHAVSLRGKGAKGLGRKIKTPSPRRSPRRSPGKPKSLRSPKTMEEIERELEEIEREGAGDAKRIAQLKTKLKKLKSDRGTGARKKKGVEEPSKVGFEKQKIMKTFMDCLASLN